MQPETPIVEEEKKKQVYTPPVLIELVEMKEVTKTGAPAAGADGTSN
jgi:hypothetical protein